MFNVSAAIDQDDVFNASFSGANDGFNSDNNVSNQSMDSEFFNEQSPMKQKADESSIFWIDWLETFPTLTHHPFKW